MPGIPEALLVAMGDMAGSRVADMPCSPIDGESKPFPNGRLERSTAGH